MRNVRAEAGEPAQQGGVGLSCKEPSTWDSCCWQAGQAAGIQPPELQERPGVRGKGESCRVMARGRGGRKGQGRKEGPGGLSQDIQCQGRPCVSTLLDLAPPASPAASQLSSASGTDFPQPQPAGPVGDPLPSTQPQVPFRGRPGPPPAGTEDAGGVPKAALHPTDPSLTVAVSGLKGRSGGSGGPRAHSGGGAVQELGTHGLGGVWLGFDAALGEAPVVDGLEEVGVT